MAKIFVAFALGNDFHAQIIARAAAAASNGLHDVTPWTGEDPSGTPIAGTVLQWIDERDGFIADVSKPNHNVTFELGYAIGRGKPIRLIRSSQYHFSETQAVGLLDTLAHDNYNLQPSLESVFKKDNLGNRWAHDKRNRDQPIFVLLPPKAMEWSRKAVSAIKKLARYKFRTFNPSEISRLTGSEAFSDASSSFGTVTFWLDEVSTEAFKHNQRSCFIFGISRGLGIPSILLAHTSTNLPLDISDIATRWDRLEQIDQLVTEFRDEVADELIDYVDDLAKIDPNALSRINFGDPIAENEQSELADFFLQTDAFHRTYSGVAHILTGRKGSGKSAIFLQVRDQSRADKQNIIIDLMPEGFHLIKLKEFILDNISYGSRKEVIAAFWEYVLWLEIAYKLLEKDQHKVKYDADLLIRYMKLENLFNSRVDTGVGDFSERLRLLSDNIISRYRQKIGSDFDASSLKSSEVLEIIYGSDIRELRDNVTDYLRIKGYVFFLFDNLDRVWTPGGFDESDGLIMIGLAEAMQEISRKFAKGDQEFRWAIFIRSDIYEFLVAGMADYGKLSPQSLEWSDRDQMKALFNHRLSNTHEGSRITLAEISELFVHGKQVVDFLIDGSLMRPRYLIRLFETARRRAITLEKAIITEQDYDFALTELGWQVLEDLDHEITDLIPNAKDFLFQILTHREDLYPDKVRYLASQISTDEKCIERILDVLIWSGAVGVEENDKPRYIFDCGYRRHYMAALITANSSIKMIIHPTLCATVD